MGLGRLRRGNPCQDTRVDDGEYRAEDIVPAIKDMAKPLGEGPEMLELGEDVFDKVPSATCRKTGRMARVYRLMVALSILNRKPRVSVVK